MTTSTKKHAWASAERAQVLGIHALKRAGIAWQRVQRQQADPSIVTAYEEAYDAAHKNMLALHEQAQVLYNAWQTEEHGPNWQQEMEDRLAERGL